MCCSSDVAVVLLACSHLVGGSLVQRMAAALSSNEVVCAAVVPPAIAVCEPCNVVTRALTTTPTFTYVSPVVNSSAATGDQYRVTVCATDPGGNSTCNSTAIGIDNTAPQMGVVRETLGSPTSSAFLAAYKEHPYTRGFTNDVEYQVDTGQVQCSFSLATDPEAIELTHMVCLSSSNGPIKVCDTVDWQVYVPPPLPDARDRNASNRTDGRMNLRPTTPLVTGKSYYCVVRAVNNAWLSNTTFSATGVRIGALQPRIIRYHLSCWVAVGTF